MTAKPPTARHLLVLVVVTLAAFWNVFPNELHLDDSYRVKDNPGVQVFWPPWRHFTDPATSAWLPRLVQYRPLLPLSLSLNYAISGDSLVGYHVGNVLLQLLAACLVYFFCRELLTHWCRTAKDPSKVALWTALLFAVHPVSGYLVNYVCSRDLLIMQVFLVAALWSYARLRRLGDSPGRWVSCLGLLLLALCAKKNAVVFPGLLLLFEVLMVRGTWRQSLRVLPAIGVVGAFLLFVRYGLGFSDLSNIEAAATDRWTYFWHQLQHHVFHYARNFAWPVPLRAEAVDPLSDTRSILGGAVLLVSVVVACWSWRRLPWLAFGLFAYLASIALTSSVIPLHSEIVGYRPYAGSPFLLLLIALPCSGRRLGDLALAVLVAYFAGVGMWCSDWWRTDQTMWQHSVDQGGSTRAYYNLALALPDDHPQKRGYYERSLELAPNYEVAHIGLGMLQIRSGEPVAGLARLRRAVELQPERAQTHRWLAEGLLQLRQYGSALDAALEAVARQPGNVKSLYLVGRAAFAARRPDPILKHLPLLQKIRPDHVDTVFLLAYAHQKKGHNQEAVAHYLRYLGQNPSRTEIHKYIAECLQAAGDPRAARHWEMFRAHQQRSKKN